MDQNQPKSKWWAPIALVVVLVLIIGGLVWWQKNKTPKENIKIGAVYTQSGELAAYGIEYRRGLEMAIEEINNRGGIKGSKIELIIEDDTGDVTKAVTAAKKMMDVDKVKYLFTGFSAQTQAIAPIAEQSKVLNICATVSRVGTGGYVFRDYWDMQDQGTATGKALKKEGIKKLGMVVLNYADTDFFMKGLKSEASGIEMLDERFNFGATDFKTQLTKVKNFNPDAILVYGFPGTETTKITQQIVELGMDNKRLFSGSSTYGWSFMYKTLSDTLVKMKAIDSWYSLDPKNQKAVDFSKKYEEKYKEPLVGDAAYPYDDVYALAEAIKKSGGDASTEVVADNLRKINYNGVAGKLTFDSNGDSQRSAYLQIYTDKGWQKYSF